MKRAPDTPMMDSGAKVQRTETIEPAKYREVYRSRFRAAVAACIVEYIERSDTGDLEDEDECTIRGALEDACKDTRIYVLGGEPEDATLEEQIISEEEADDEDNTDKDFSRVLQAFYDGLNDDNAAHLRTLVSELDDALNDAATQTLDSIDAFNSLSVPLEWPLAASLCRVNYYEKFAAAAFEAHILSGGINVDVSKIKERFAKTVARELRQSINNKCCTLAAYAQKFEPFKCEKDAIEEDKRDALGATIEDTNLAIDAYYDGLINDDAEESRRLVAELDVCLQCIVDDELQVAIGEIDYAIARDKWYDRERASAAVFNANSRGADGGRKAEEPIIGPREWEERIQYALGDIANCIKTRLGAAAFSVYNDGRFYINNDRYYLETQVKAPIFEPRSTGQVAFRLGHAVEKSVERFRRILGVIDRLNAAINERADKPAAPVSTKEWEDIMTAGNNRGNELVAKRLNSVYVPTSMSATINGMLHAMIKTPAELPTLNKADFECLISIVLPQAVSDVCTDFAIFHVLVKRTAPAAK